MDINASLNNVRNDALRFFLVFFSLRVRCVCVARVLLSCFVFTTRRRARKCRTYTIFPCV